MKIFRVKRHKLLLDSIRKANAQVILDLGGTNEYWDTYGQPTNTTIILFNTQHQEGKANRIYFKGDANNLPFALLNSVDFIFSNSLIEHIEKQGEFGLAITSSDKPYFIQTPNKNFFFEPHYRFPLFQFLPKKIQVWLTNHFSLGNYKKGEYETINLLNKDFLKLVFQGGELIPERFCGLTKSWIVTKGV